MSGVKRVLVVEDDPLLLLLLVDMLSDHGIEAVPFTSAQNAQSAFADHTIDGLITDIECEARDRGQIERLVTALEQRGYLVGQVELN